MELLNYIKSSNIPEIKKYLILNPKAINQIYSYDGQVYQTPLLCALEHSSIETVKLLISCVDYGADINMNVPGRLSPIARAISWSTTSVSKEKVKLLLKYGADTNLQNNYLLNLVEMSNSRQIAFMLLEHDIYYNGNIDDIVIFVNKIKRLNAKN